MKEKIDEAQLKAININENVVVSAGAGSGKTSVLVKRYIRLIREQKATIEEILTLTFTRKAAAEMYERIYSLLSEEKTEILINKQLTEFEKAHISTIDSFCANIVRNCSHRFGVPPDFSLDDEEAARIAQEVSLKFIIENREDRIMQKLISSIGFEGVWKEFFSPLGSEYLHIARSEDFSRMYERQIRELKGLLEKGIGRLGDIFYRIRTLDSSSSSTLQDTLNSLPSEDEIAGLAKNENYSELKQTLKRIKTRKPGRVNSPGLLQFKECLDELKNEINLLEEIIEGLRERELTKGIFDLLSKFQRRLSTEKREKKVLSFRDSVEMAVRILTEDKKLRQYYKEKFKYIMIDEFQDNNLLQKKLLYLLTEKKDRLTEEPKPEDLEEDKLFLVGDEKQSIYRFRGADVSVFKQLTTEIERAGGSKISLDYNYRSEPGLINFYNLIFEKVMANPTQSYDARFEPLKKAEARLKTEPQVKIFYKPVGEKTPQNVLHSDDSEAYCLAEYIKRCVENKTLPLPDGKTADYSDFALLMRSTSNQIKYERAFRRFGIPYSTQNVRALFLEAPINDMYNVMQLAVYPSDRTAYAGFLRSPFVNISDTSLITILAEYTLPFETEAEKIANIEDREKYLMGKAIFEFVQNNADRIPIAELIRHLWYRFGYRYTLLRNSEYQGYIEYYDYFLELAQRADRRGESLAVFLDFIRPNLGKYERISDLEIVKEESRGVQLLTIHKAKGLQFPVVILANTGNLGRKTGIGSAPYYISGEFGLTINVVKNSGGIKERERYNYFYRIGKEENEKKDLAEIRRLFYVALTRAQYHLVISGCHNSRNRNSPEAMINMLFSAIGWNTDEMSTPPDIPGLHFSLEEIRDVSEEEYLKHRVKSRRAHIEELKRVYETSEIKEFNGEREEYSVTELVSMVKPEEAKSDYLRTGGIQPTGHEDEAAFGELTHLILKKKIDGAFKSEEFIKEIPTTLKNKLRPEELGNLINEGESLCLSFFQSELGKLAANAENRETELAFTYLLNTYAGEKYLNGRIDLLFQIKDQAYVVDFKTDSSISAGAYDLQMYVYRLAAEELTGKKAKSFLFYLRTGEAVEITAEFDLENYITHTIANINLSQ